MLFRNISYLFRNKSKSNWYIAESLYISDHKIGKYAEKPQDKRDSPRIWRTIYVSYRTGQRYNVRKRLLFIGNVPPGIFWNQVHTKKENCGAKILNSFPIWKKAWEDIMLEKIMDLQILLYSMAALGTLGAIGMLTTNLTYRRMLKSTGSKNTGTKNTQGAGSGSAWRKNGWDFGKHGTGFFTEWIGWCGIRHFCPLWFLAVPSIFPRR